MIIADIPYNLGNNAFASDPRWYKDGDNRNGESKLAGNSLTQIMILKSIISLIFVVGY